MQSDCYRCGSPIEGQIAFCSACGAPQIRVSKAIEQPTEATESPESHLPSREEGPASTPPAGAHFTTGIEWRYFLRFAAPLAAVTGMLTVDLRPLSLFVLLPAGLVWAISRYRQQRPGRLRSGQGARMGAVMGLLSFGFFLLAIAFNPAKYRDIMVGNLHEVAARNPDPQTQQVLQWFATPDGMFTFAAIALCTVLAAFLVVGMSSGALAVALGKARNRP
jgi:hypothetical protein